LGENDDLECVRHDGQQYGGVKAWTRRDCEGVVSHGGDCFRVELFILNDDQLGHNAGAQGFTGRLILPSPESMNVNRPIGITMIAVYAIVAGLGEIVSGLDRKLFGHPFEEHHPSIFNISNDVGPVKRLGHLVFVSLDTRFSTAHTHWSRSRE
jgi:hypothetical protein